MDDVLIMGTNKREHDERLTAVLERLQNAGVTLNPAKCEFGRSSVKFLGNIIDYRGIRADPEKITAICQLKPPDSVTELRQFMGMVNQLGRFSPHLAEISQPLRELLTKKNEWVWGPDQETAFQRVKDELTRPSVLVAYDLRANTKVSADASSHGLGAVLLQKSKGTWKPVAYASRAMSPTEKRYAQIEKEALAITWACDRFSQYLLGRAFEVETDHKPLVPLLSTKHLDDLPPRVLRFRLRMARYQYTIHHIPGKLLCTADALSRKPTLEAPGADPLEEEVESFVNGVINGLPGTQPRLRRFLQEQKEDLICRRAREHCQFGWPKAKPEQADFVPYWNARASLTLNDDLLLFNNRIVVPPSLRKETLQAIHEGHQGIVRCRLRAKISVWWPGITQHIAQLIDGCPVCAQYTPLRREPLMATPLPAYPWQMVGTDLFEHAGHHYLLLVDYFSRFPEMTKLNSTTSGSVISTMKLQCLLGTGFQKFCVATTVPNTLRMISESLRLAMDSNTSQAAPIILLVTDWQKERCRRSRI